MNELIRDILKFATHPKIDGAYHEHGYIFIKGFTEKDGKPAILDFLEKHQPVKRLKHVTKYRALFLEEKNERIILAEKIEANNEQG